VCDGPSYRDARSARDRERLRPQVLESLGWSLHRVWGPDWLRDQAGELRKAIDVIESAGTVVEPPPPNEGHDEPPIEEFGGRGPEVSDASEDGGGPVASPPPYQLASPRRPDDGKDLAAMAVGDLAGRVVDVVRVEGPVHASEVARRIGEAAGLRR